MDDFSQLDMLILSNYVYFNCSTNASFNTIGDTIDSLKNENGRFDIKKIYSQGGISVNISEEEALDIFERIDRDANLRSLHVTRKLEENDIRGVLFSNEDESKSCLVFRGTGGTYDAWHDNVRGEHETDTKLQKIAADFVRYECSNFNNISVTGHSKGGNLAQYVTVVCSSQISNCTSFDGQGFSKDFIKKYDKEIKESKDKIVSISAYNDYVNILLTPIAGTRLFVKNEGKNLDGHSSATLLNSIRYNEDGSINLDDSRVFQGAVAWMLEETTDNLVDIIDLLPNGGNEAVSGIIASAVASVMSADKSDDYKKSQYRNALKSFGSYSANILDLISDESASVSIQFRNSSLGTEGMRKACEILYDSSHKLIPIIERAEEVNKNLSYIIAGRYFTERKLVQVIEKMTYDRIRIRNYATILKNICKLYESDEEELLHKLTTRAYSTS